MVLALASSGSTAAAASSLHLTQSAVSRALLTAEDRLGVPLFLRRPRGLSPTAAGQRLLDGAGPLIAQLRELERHARDGGDDAPTRIRMVCECYTAYRWIPSTLTALRGVLPRLEVSLAFEHTASPIAALSAGDLDVALVTTSKVPRALRERPLFSDRIVFVMAASHPLARGRRSLTPADLLAHPLIASSQTPEPEVGWFVSQVFGKRPRGTFLRFPLTEAMVDAARAGMGIAVLSEWIAAPYLTPESGLVAKSLRGKSLARPWRIAYRPSLEREIDHLVDALARAAPKLSVGVR